MTNNPVLQGVKTQIYNTVKLNWTKKSGVSMWGAPNGLIAEVNAAIANPNGFVFGSLGWQNSSSTAKVEASHPNGLVAATAGTSSSPTTLAKLDVVTFNGATFKAIVNYGQAYAELWTPPDII